MKYNAKPGKDENAATLQRALGNSQPPGKTGGPVRSKPNPKALAPAKSPRPKADPKKTPKTYPGRTKLNYGI